MAVLHASKTPCDAIMLFIKQFRFDSVKVRGQLYCLRPITNESLNK